MGHSMDRKLDITGDGIVDDKDIQIQKDLKELELREEKADVQKNMARAAMISMFIFTLILFTPLLSDERVNALSDLLGMFYIAQASIVGAYMGFTTWMSKK